MAVPGEEFTIGKVASENNYDPSWDTPTWFDLWAMLDQEKINRFTFIPMGKIHYTAGRAFSTPSVVLDKEDVINQLNEYAREIGVDRAIIWIDPEHSPRLIERICGLPDGSTEHVTGFHIKVIS